MLKQLYLTVYNVAAMCGWAMVWMICYRTICAIFQSHSFADGTFTHTTDLGAFWTEVEFPLKVAQTMAVMEILHAVFGVVKSSAATTALQVFSRVWILWAVMAFVPAATVSLFTVLCVTSWATVEVPRYLFYTLKQWEAVPSGITWLRYSLFYILYPTGISGELGTMYVAFAFLKQHMGEAAWQWHIGPLALEPLWVYALVAITYIPGSPKMYNHMIKERTKQLYPKPKTN